MNQKKNSCNILNMNQDSNILRNFNLADISLPLGYSIETFAYGLNAPISMVFTDDGDILIGESGLAVGSPRVLRLGNGIIEVVAEYFNIPISGINVLNKNIYVSHRGFITVIEPDGRSRNIISGLPSYGDYGNHQVIFGPDRKMYFGQGTATNSGVVGLDNQWVVTYPSVHDNPGDFIMMNGQNFQTNNILVESNEIAFTGAFSPYGVPNMPFEVKKGFIRSNGSILRANLDGSELEVYAWGLRNPFQLKFDQMNRLLATNHGFDIRGSRPIDNSPDELIYVTQGTWYGWPDYTGGEPVTSTRFRPEGAQQPQFLIRNHPQTPPRPYALFPTGSNVAGFDINYNINFGNIGDIYVAEFGSLGREALGGRPYAGIGHRISKLDPNTRIVSTFAINKSGFAASLTREGGFGNPVDVVFGPDQAMYILDFGISVLGQPSNFIPNTGAIWKVTKN